MMLRYMTARGLSRDLPEHTVKEVTRQSYLLMAGFALSIPVLFVTPLGWLLWIVVPFAAGQLLRSRRERKADGDPG